MYREANEKITNKTSKISSRCYLPILIVHRALWILVFTICISYASILTLEIFLKFRESPIVSTMEAEFFPTSELQFPGVAICTINRISRRSAMKLADKISKANITELSVEEIFDNIISLGDLYDSHIMRESNYNTTNELLSKFYNNNYDITDLMEYLTPQCSDILLQCYFHNKQKNCTNMFSVGKTQNGFCCTFNYITALEDRPKFTKILESEVYTVGNVGLHFGLTVSMEPLLDDYSYTIHPMSGWKVMIFDAFDFPDSGSGSVSEILIGPSSEEFVELKAVGAYSTNSIRSYPVEKRGCIFADELKSNYTSYTISECVVACRLEHIWAKCKCRPFFYPRQGSTENTRKTCTVENISCLTKYYGMSYKIIPYEDSNLESALENENVVRCKHCYPECNDMTYLIRSVRFELQPGYYNTSLFPDMNVKDQSILHIYFVDSGIVYMKQDEYYRWYEHFSSVGGFYGFFVGFSIVSIVEIIYYIMLYLLEICLHSKTAEEAPRENNTLSIYWNEFPPRTRMNANKTKHTATRY
ncbi:Sodium channel protein Nach [Anthophora quadrimaculata]